MTTLPYFPFYVGDYLRDTARLSTEAHGAYVLIMLDYWTRGAPPDDDDVLATITKSSTARWKKLRPLLVPFFIIEDGKWQHSRIERELVEAENKHKKASEAGKAGAIARWQPHSDRIGDANATALRQQCQSESEPKKKEKKDAAPDGAQPKTDEADLFDRGKKILGKDAGGLIAKVLKAKAGNIPLARAAIETAATKSNPREYVGAIIRGADPPERTVDPRL